MVDGKKRIAELEKRVKELERENQALTIRTEVLPLAWAAGIRPEAVEDAAGRAEVLFEVLPGRRLVKKEGGQSVAEWLQESKKTASHWWPTNATPEHKTDDRKLHVPAQWRDENPFTKKHWNLTKQGELLKFSQPLAEQMAKTAGVQIGAAHPAE